MGRKHWEKEKLLVRSNFSFSHGVFKRLVLQTRKNQGLFRKGLDMQEKLPKSKTFDSCQLGLCNSKKEKLSQQF